MYYVFGLSRAILTVLFTAGVEFSCVLATVMHFDVPVKVYIFFPTHQSNTFLKVVVHSGIVTAPSISP